MWNITPEDVDRAKEVLKGRSAAIQARYDDEIQRLKAEIDDIEAFERVATAFAHRHKPDEASASVEPDPIAPLEALPIAADVAVAESETERSDDPLSGDHGESESSPGGEAKPIAAAANVAQNASSRWRIRV